jgi:hypothetical protein
VTWLLTSWHRFRFRYRDPGAWRVSILDLVFSRTICAQRQPSTFLSILETWTNVVRSRLTSAIPFLPLGLPCWGAYCLTSNLPVQIVNLSLTDIIRTISSGPFWEASGGTGSSVVFKQTSRHLASSWHFASFLAVRLSNWRNHDSPHVLVIPSTVHPSTIPRLLLLTGTDNTHGTSALGQ